jgi:glycosyltransferase involved in cell wall biosynthesis
MRVVLADPPAYTPPYDHELAGALARAGADVTLVTSPFRFGDRPTATGYAVDESFYRLSSGIGWSPLRLAVKAVEHPFGMRSLMRRAGDVLHLQWLAEPRYDARALRRRHPLVFTAHDILPRRTAHRTELWHTLFSRFDRVVVHSERGRARLEEFGVPCERLALIPHPVFRSSPAPNDDGRTVLSLGVIRPYKGLEDTIAAVRRVPDARLLVAGDPRIPLDELRAEAGPTADWRLGYLGPTELERALGETTVAVFPYREELDQSGALLQALGGSPRKTGWGITRSRSGSTPNAASESRPRSEWTTTRSKRPNSARQRPARRAVRRGSRSCAVKTSGREERSRARSSSGTASHWKWTTSAGRASTRRIASGCSIVFSGSRTAVRPIPLERR